MSTEKKPKRDPEDVCACLTRDVYSILSVCLHQFKEGHEIDEDCFDVDAIISGRSTSPKIRYERQIQPAAWASRRVLEGSDRPYTTAAKGQFIPQTHFGPRFA